MTDQSFTHRSPKSYLLLSHSTSPDAPVSTSVYWCVCSKSSLLSWRTFPPKDTRAHTHTESSSRGAAAARTPPHCFYVCAGTVQTEVVNMAADGMVLTNHDHQTRVGILTGKETVC